MKKSPTLLNMTLLNNLFKNQIVWPSHNIWTLCRKSITFQKKSLRSEAREKSCRKYHFSILNFFLKLLLNSWFEKKNEVTKCGRIIHDCLKEVRKSRKWYIFQYLFLQFSWYLNQGKIMFLQIILLYYQKKCQLSEKIGSDGTKGA